MSLYAWTEEEFLKRTEGSPIRRIGHERWQRNIAVAMGNALQGVLVHSEREFISDALIISLPSARPLLAEHIHWALT